MTGARVVSTSKHRLAADRRTAVLRWVAGAERSEAQVLRRMPGLRRLGPGHPDVDLRTAAKGMPNFLAWD